MNRRRLLRLALGLAGASVVGCQWGAGAGGPRQPASSSAPGGLVELRELGDRPAVSLVPREGDPQPAVAVAVAHDFGSEASVALGSLLRARLAAKGFPDASARPHALGLVVTTLVDSPPTATRFVQAVTEAFARPVANEELGGRDRLGASVRHWAGPAEAAVGACAGELGLPEAGIGQAPLERPDRIAVESWRARVHSARAVAFAALGPRALLDSVAGALVQGPAWPTTGGAVDAWPSGDQVGVDPSSQREARLSVAYRVADPAAALEAATTLGQPGAIVAARVASLEPGWRVERVVATSRPRGACLRVDLQPGRAEALSTEEVAKAVVIADEEARAALGVRADPWTLDDAVLRPSDPRDAAGAAAWRALSARQSPGPSRRFVSWVVPAAEKSARGSGELERWVADFQSSWARRAAVERRVRVEPGQGELWALVASTCGTSAESLDDAGLGALAVRALAARRSHWAGVTLEPWVAPDGLGLLAHAPRAGPNESPEQQARRVGEALGRAAAASRLGGSDAAEQRSVLLAEIGPGSRRGWFAALDAASSGHPAWLEPRGAWKSLSTLATAAVETRRRTLLGGPLRLAVLANASPAQAAAVAAGFERWARPLRGSGAACPVISKSAARSGEISVEIGGAAPPRAYLAVPLPTTPSGIPREAEWTAFSLNRPGGWLERALASPELGASARATALGGREAAALIVEIATLETELGPAVAQVRALLDRLAKGAATEQDAELARRHFAAEQARATLDPRFRVVELWRPAAPPAPDLASWRRFHQSLGAAAQLVVLEKAR